MRLSVLIATTGRIGLERAIQSVVSQRHADDELLLVGWGARVQGLAERYGARFISHRPANDWGHTERNYASPMATGDYICHLDDDDCHAPGARALIEQHATAHPGRPLIFRMQFPWHGVNGRIGQLWSTRQVAYGNVGTPMIVLPNIAAKFGQWAPVFGGDFHFMSTMRWRSDEIVWSEDVIALIRPEVVPAYV